MDFWLFLFWYPFKCSFLRNFYLSLVSTFMYLICYKFLLDIQISQVYCFPSKQSSYEIKHISTTLKITMDRYKKINIENK